MRYMTQGVCSSAIDIELKDGVIDSVKFTGGCNGNLQGIGALVKGMTPEEAISRLKGIRCGFKSTSCPDQLARALESMISQKSGRNALSSKLRTRTAIDPIW